MIIPWSQPGGGGGWSPSLNKRASSEISYFCLFFSSFFQTPWEIRLGHKNSYFQFSTSFCRLVLSKSQSQAVCRWNCSYCAGLSILTVVAALLTRPGGVTACLWQSLTSHRDLDGNPSPATFFQAQVFSQSLGGSQVSKSHPPSRVPMIALDLRVWLPQVVSPRLSQVVTRLSGSPRWSPLAFLPPLSNSFGNPLSLPAPRSQDSCFFFFPLQLLSLSLCKTRSLWKRAG